MNKNAIFGFALSMVLSLSFMQAMNDKLEKSSESTLLNLGNTCWHLLGVPGIQSCSGNNNPSVSGVLECNGTRSNTFSAAIGSVHWMQGFYGCAQYVY